LLVRPVTPRFLVVDDHAMLAAVVQNNTPDELQGLPPPGNRFHP
jgi:hypothetical protein